MTDSPERPSGVLAVPQVASLEAFGETSLNGRAWKPEEEAYLREHYRDGLTKGIAAHLKVTVARVQAKAGKLGLEKSTEYLQDPANRCRLLRGHSFGREFQFRKGQVPANKGLRRPGYAPGRMKESQFRKGQKSMNYLPIGTVAPDSYGYLRIKVRDPLPGEATGAGNSKSWPQYHRYLWEQAHGPIPPKHLVVFKDRDKAHCVIGNLELISMAENARRNRMWSTLPRELAEVIQLKGALKRQIRRLDGKEQDQRSA